MSQPFPVKKADSNRAGIPLRQQKKDLARRRLLDATGRLIQAQGYARTRTRDIAQAAQLSYQTLYNYFPGKARLVLALLTERSQPFEDDFQQVLQAYEGDLLRALDALQNINFQIIDGPDRDLWRVTSIELLEQSPIGPEADPESIQRISHPSSDKTLNSLLREARDSGELSVSVNLELLTETLLDLLDMTLLQFLRGAHPGPAACRRRLSNQTRLVASPYLTSYSPPFSPQEAPRS